MAISSDVAEWSRNQTAVVIVMHYPPAVVNAWIERTTIAHRREIDYEHRAVESLAVSDTRFQMSGFRFQENGAKVNAVSWNLNTET